MADDQRPYRGNDVGTRSGQTRAAGASGNDPLAELARLIGQSDPFGEFARDSARRTGAAQEAEAAAPAAVTDPQDYGAPAYAQPTYAAPPAGADAAYPAEDQIPAYLTQQAQLGGKVGQVGQAGQFAAADGYGQDAYYQGKAPYQAGDEDYYDDAPPQRRRMGILVIAGVFALAVIGTAGAFGYRALFGASGAAGQPPVIKAESAPSKIVPANTGKDTSKLITDRVGGSPQNEKLVSREEQPVAIKDKPAGVIFPPQGGSQPGGAQTAALGSGVVASEPKKIRTIAIHPDGSVDAAPAAPPAPAMPDPPARQAAPAPMPQRVASPPPAEPAPRPAAPRPAPVQQAAPAPSNAPLSLSPNAQPARAAAAPARTASVAPTPLAPSANAGSSARYAVQVSSQRSEAEAEAAFRGLQAKFPSQLGSRQHFIHRVDLGAKGIYFRAMVGPYTNAGEANELCTSLKAAGGQCLIQRN